MKKNFPTSIIIEGQDICIDNNIFYSSGGGMIGGQDVIVRNLPTPLFMSHNLFYGKIAKRFEKLDRDPVKGNPEFAGSGSAPYQYQLRATSPAVGRGVKKQGPAIPSAGTGIFKDVPAYPVVDFYGNRVEFSSEAPNIGACNAHRGKLVSRPPLGGMAKRRGVIR